MNLRIQTQEEVTRIKNRIARWFSIYFPEYKNVYGNPDAVSGMLVLKAAPLPMHIKALGVAGILKIWREKKLRGAGEKRAKTLVSAAEHSIGSPEALNSARIELQNLLADFEKYNNRLGELMEQIKEQLQLQKLAGLAIVSNESGKHKGESHISYRGRKRLRYVLYELALTTIGKNAEFKELYRYYTERKVNPLKKMQSVIAVACKIIRVFYAILKNGVDYDGTKMLSDIHRPEAYMQVA